MKSGSGIIISVASATPIRGLAASVGKAKNPIYQENTLLTIVT